MKKRVIKDTYSRLKEQRREQGFSLVEILVVVALLAVVGVAITAAVLNTTEANDNVNASTVTQRELLDTTSAVTRDVSTSTEIIAAGDYHLIMRANSGDINQVVSYFFWSASGKDLADAVTDRLEIANVNASELPDFPAVMEMRENPDGTKIIRPLIPGFQDRSDDFQNLFTFYENGGKDEMEISRMSGNINGSLPEDRVSAIERIEMRFAAQPSGRDKAMEMATSVTPKSVNTGGGGDEFTAAPPPAPAAPFLRASLPAKTSVTNVDWDRVEGATGYTLYRHNRLQNLDTITTTFDRDTTSTTDSDIVWGESYTYHVIAHGVGGNSPQSNKVTVTAVPPAPELNGNANDRTNNLTWEHVNGVGPNGTPANVAGTGYRLYRIADNGNLSNIMTNAGTSHNDSGRSFGDRTQYYLVPYNQGGEGFASETITIYTRPPATTVSVNISARTTTANVTWTEAKNALNGYTVQRSNRNETTRQVGTTRQGVHRFNNSGLKWGERYSYTVRSSNSGGESNISNSAHAYVVPPAPRISGNASGTNNTISWGEVNGVNTMAEPRGDSASGYKVYRAGTSSPIYTGHNRSFVDRNRPYGSTAVYYVVPFNRGGDGLESNRITLVSPPATPNVTVRDFNNGNDGFNRISWNTPSGTKYFRYQRDSNTIVNQGLSTSTNDNSPGVDSRRTYKVQACNDAGCSPSWGSGIGLQPPGQFRLTSSSQVMSDHTWLVGAPAPDNKPRNNPASVSLQWGTSSGADGYSVKRGSSTVRNKSTSRSLNQGSLGSNTVYTYHITAHGDTSGINRAQAVKIQTGPALPREVRGSWTSKGGSSQMTTALYTLHNGNAGHGSNNNGYRVEVNSAIAHGSGSGVRLSSIKGWSRWNHGSSFRSPEWKTVGNGPDGYGAMLFVNGRTNLQSGATAPTGANGSSWDNRGMYRNNGYISMLTSFSMRTYGQGWGGRVGTIPQNRPWGHYQSTCSTRGYYQVMNGGSYQSGVPGC